MHEDRPWRPHSILVHQPSNNPTERRHDFRRPIPRHQLSQGVDRWPSEIDAISAAVAAFMMAANRVIRKRPS